MYIIVFVTTKDVSEAQRIAAALVNGKLAACVNVINGVRSIFTWKGKVDKAKEALLIIKSRKSLFPKLVAKVKKLHSYDCPEVIAMPIIGGNRDYLNWVKDSCA